MNVKELLEWANDYVDADDVSAAEAMLSVLIELYTSDVLEDGESIDSEVFQRAWERLTRELTVAEWLRETQALAAGVDVLAANLNEAGRDDLAEDLRELSAPRFEGATRSPELDLKALRRVEDVPAPGSDNRMWVPRQSAGLKTRQA